MIDQYLKIQFANFTPSFQDRGLIFKVMREIEYSAPSDSSVQLEVRKTRGGFKGVCRVASQVGIFTADCEAESLNQLMSLIEKKIGVYLNTWKLNRFSLEHKPSGEFSPAS